MRWSKLEDEPCSVARTISVIGDRWTLLILRDCFLRVRRFEDFQARLGITRPILADRLKKLVAKFVLAKVPYQEGPLRYEYRLTPKGLYRWHTKCCNTPVGNTLGPAVPFVGIPVQVFDAPRPDEVFGAPIGAILGKYAIGDPPAGSTGLNLSLLLRAVGRVLGWRLGGKTWPHPFFARDTRAPVYPLTVVSQERREALRALCGPRPTAQAVS